MNKTINLLALLCISAIGSVVASGNTDPILASPYFSIRSQGRDKVIQMIGTAGILHEYCNNQSFYTWAVTPEFTRSTRPNDITDCLFGQRSTTCSTDCNDQEQCIHIQGSQVTNRRTDAWLADSFYLPTDFQSTICFEPRIKNFLLNLDLYLNLDWCNPGFYFRLYGPIVWSKWNLNFCETVSATGSNSYDAGYFASTGIGRNQLLKDFSSYACGNAPAPVGDLIFNGLQFARICCDNRAAAGFAELRAEFGWDFWHDECNHFGVNVQTATPTGKRPKACFAFEPMIGNGHHWELGAGFTGHHRFYLREENDRNIGFYYDVNITHLFATKQRRTFDLCGKENSRYMLAQRLGKPVQLMLSGSPIEDTLQGAASVLATAQFQQEYTPVANLSTIDVTVSAALQADIVAMFNFCLCNWSIDLGYNFWMRSTEKIHPWHGRNSCEREKINLCSAATENTWALKGDARVYGFGGTNGIGVNINQPVALSATQSNATIYQGTNAQATTQPTTVVTITNPAKQNVGIDNALFANADAFLIHTPTTQGGVADLSNQIKTSIEPIFLSCNDIDFHGTKGLSHKLFLHVSHTWWDHECWIPFIGIGGFGEFGKNDDSRINNRCAPCTEQTDSITCSLSEWGVWIKGGISY